MAAAMARSLPPELLRAIFSAARPPRAADEDVISPWNSRTVLSYEARARAELVCKHWRTALSEEPGQYTSLSVNPPWPGAGWNSPPAAKAAATAAVNKALGRARALAARAPIATHVHMQVLYKLPPKLLAAHVEALNTLLSGAGGGLSFTLVASTPARADAEAALAAMAPHATCERLEMDWRTTGRQPFDFMPSKRLPSLPDVRRIRVRLNQHTMARFSLPMPRLEELALPETPEMFAPLVSRAVALVPAGTAVPFPALRRLDVATVSLVLAAPTMPALEHLGAKLYFPQAELRLTLPASGTLPSRLTSLDLDASTMHTLAMMQEGGDYGEDRSVRTNELAPLLSAAARSLRQLRLTIAEPPNADLEAAVRAATGLTSLELRFTSREWAAQDGARLDCCLLGRMVQLRCLRTDAAGRLEGPAALAAFPWLMWRWRARRRCPPLHSTHPA